MLERLAEAADDADQSLRAQRAGPASASLPHQQHDCVSLQERNGRGRRHEQERNDSVVSVKTGRSRAGSRVSAIATSVVMVACASSGRSPSETTSMDARATARSAWTDSVIATMTLRQKV